MAYDEELAERVRELLTPQPDVREQKMFGGISFMLRGNFGCGVTGENLVVRVGPEGYEAALARPHAREMDFTGRPMNGWVFVSRPGWRTDAGLEAWVNAGVAFALSLPAK